MKRIIVQGSSRSNGNTNKIVQFLQSHLECDFIDLSECDIRQYDYKNRNQNDDFLTTIEKIVEYDLIIFATPVYWYSMSGIMKTFFDRITDCLNIDKEIGRKLHGKNMAASSFLLKKVLNILGCIILDIFILGLRKMIHQIQF